jgi:hypothetical protein
MGESMASTARVLAGLCLLASVSNPVWAQSGVPRYCKTDAGVLGPYPNDGSVKVGDACFGTKAGQRYEGVAVMSKDGS